ncbi:MAG: 4Fe-4S binding protein [Deltaproteobacteria bacterium]|nr:4Fe-4S binding protein [Deltaproteobacteria bacterium]
MSYLRVHSEKCTGCRACEFACSYHHRKIFNPRLASLYIHRDEREGKIAIVLYSHLSEEERRKRFTCDQCQGEGEPLCVTYCVAGAITRAADER